MNKQKQQRKKRRHLASFRITRFKENSLPYQKIPKGSPSGYKKQTLYPYMQKIKDRRKVNIPYYNVQNAELTETQYTKEEKESFFSKLITTEYTLDTPTIFENPLHVLSLGTIRIHDNKHICPPKYYTDYLLKKKKLLFSQNLKKSIKKKKKKKKKERYELVKNEKKRDTEKRVIDTRPKKRRKIT